MSDLHQAVQEYLAVRRALGFKLEREGQLLDDFAGFCARRGEPAVTVAAALAWATLPQNADPVWRGARLTAVRTFARWRAAFDPATEVPPAGLLPQRSRRAEPYPYSDADILALLEQARAIRSPLRAATYQTLIGLLAVSGMRVGEAIALNRGDADLDQRVLRVRNAKFGKSRLVICHPSTAEALHAYERVRDARWPDPVTPAFFVSVAGTRLIYKNVHQCFHRLAGQAGLAPLGPRCRPRIHDLRHRFALQALLGWYRDGADIGRQLPALSACLGHVRPQDTYWYLRAAPELLALAAERLQRLPGAQR
jgi:integrase/recombinase XerD